MSGRSIAAPMLLVWVRNGATGIACDDVIVV